MRAKGGAERAQSSQSKSHHSPLDLQGQDRPPPDSKLMGTVDKLLVRCPQLASRASAALHWLALCSSSSSWTPRPTLSLNRFESLVEISRRGNVPFSCCLGLLGLDSVSQLFNYFLGHRAPHARFGPFFEGPCSRGGAACQEPSLHLPQCSKPGYLDASCCIHPLLD